MGPGKWGWSKVSNERFTDDAFFDCKGPFFTGVVIMGVEEGMFSLNVVVVPEKVNNRKTVNKKTTEHQYVANELSRRHRIKVPCG